MIQIPNRFRKAVTLHVVRNLLFESSSPAPLIMGIPGPSGDGKTFQCSSVLRDLGVEVFPLSSSELESADAGRPAELIREVYQSASAEMARGSPATVVVDDIDTGIGSWGSMTQYTVNRQHVFAVLMHLADAPSRVARRQTHRVPMILTGNDFSVLHEPLVRAGRMWMFPWVPTSAEKEQVVSGIFPSLSPQDVRILVQAYESRPVAFFASLSSAMRDRLIEQLIEERGGAKKLIKEVVRGWSRPVEGATEPSDVEQILKVAEQMDEGTTPQNFLGYYRKRLADVPASGSSMETASDAAGDGASERDDDSRTGESDTHHYGPRGTRPQ